MSFDPTPPLGTTQPLDTTDQARRPTSSSSSTRPARPARQRLIARLVHLLAAAVLGTFVYAPAAVAAPLHLALQFVVIPAAVVTGVFLWKQAQLRRLVRRLSPKRGAVSAAR